MGYEITDKCNCCALCVNICPANAIHVSKTETKFEINEDCINCGACMYECPIEAIIETDED